MFSSACFTMLFFIKRLFFAAAGDLLKCVFPIAHYSDYKLKASSPRGLLNAYRSDLPAEMTPLSTRLVLLLVSPICQLKKRRFPADPFQSLYAESDAIVGNDI